MKNSFLLICPLFFAGLASILISNNAGPLIKSSNGKPDLSKVIACAPVNDERFYAGKDGKFIRILPGWGNHGYAVNTQNDSAQLYFNQGLSMYYSYHSREATASFKEATRFDSTCAMMYWAQALSLGPSYNFGYSYKMHVNIPSVVKNMNRYGSTATPKEQDLVAAMNKRYNLQDTADTERKQLNVAYATAMKTLVQKYPDDIDIKALYTDAVMLLHSWDFWYKDGTPKEWTPELVKFCKDILQKDPIHPAALHYYIHITEASRKPEVALASADSLIKLFPGVAHMVHMSSHEYERIGYYAKGVTANEKADESLYVYDSLAKGLFRDVYHVPHYFAVDIYCALSGGMYKKAVSKWIELRKMTEPEPDNVYQQYLLMYRSQAAVRMGKWQDILSDTVRIKSDWSFAGILDDFAKGMAHTKTGSLETAQKYLQQLREKKNDKILRDKFAPHTSTPYECATVAENILYANILFNQGKHNAAITAIKNAMRVEDSLIYSEPKLWMLPARQWLGSFYLSLKQYHKAENVYRDDLVWNPGNGWSALGLYNSLRAQKKTGELVKLKRLYSNSFSHADEMPVGSVY
jgi:tetratricopeptide (TPR) repeat protein